MVLQLGSYGRGLGSKFYCREILEGLREEILDASEVEVSFEGVELIETVFLNCLLDFLFSEKERTAISFSGVGQEISKKLSKALNQERL